MSKNKNLISEHILDSAKWGLLCLLSFFSTYTVLKIGEYSWL